MRATLALFTVLALLVANAAWAATDPAAAPMLLTLEKAYDLALATDQSIRVAYWEVRKANLLTWSALTKLGPSVTASADYNRSANTTVAPTTEIVQVPGISAAPGATVTHTAFETFYSHAGSSSASISLQQPLVDLTVFPAYRLGKISKQVARLQHQFTIRETLFGVASAYFEVLKQQRLVIVNHLTFELSNEQLNLAQKRANVGLVTRTDVLRAQVTLESARQSLVASENTLELDLNTLGNIVNFPTSTKYRVAEPDDYPTDVPSFDDLLRRAYDRREDLTAKTLAIDEDIARKNEVLGEYGPRVVLEANSQAANNTGTSRARDESWSADIAVQIPILTGGQREIDLLTARHQIEETKLQRDIAKKGVENDVKTAWLSVRTLEVTLKASRVQVAAAEQSYKDLQVQYAAGKATSVDVLSGLNDLDTARKNLAQQTYDYQVALRNLEEVSGIFQNERVQKAKVR
jgi:outer membrane protein TolC